MKRWMLSLLVIVIFSILSCGDSENDSDNGEPVYNEISISKVADPVNPCDPSKDQACHGYYRAVLPTIRGEVLISVNDKVKAELYLGGTKEELEANSPVTSADLSEGIIFYGNNKSFRFKVNPDGTNPQIYDINFSLKSTINSFVLKETSVDYVYVFWGESIAADFIVSNRSLCGLRKGNTLYLASELGVFQVQLGGDSFSYNSSGIMITGKIHDNLIISGLFSDIAGEAGTEFYLVNKEYFEKAKLIISDATNDTSPYSIAGADIKSVYAIQTNNYFAIKIQCQGSLYDFWFNYTLSQGFPYLGMIMANNKSNSVEKYNAYRIQNMSPTSFSLVNDFAVRSPEALYIVLDKNWSTYSGNEVEFYIVSGYLPEKWLDKTPKVIVSLN